MAVTSSSIQVALNWATLTEPVTRVMNTLPRPLPEVLYTRTKNVPGHKYRRLVFRPSRKSARQTPYGAPPRQVPQTGAGFEDVVMIHSAEEIDCGIEVLEMYMAYEGMGVQSMANQELDRRSTDFGVRQQNLRNTCIHMSIANGKIFFDANGDLASTDQVASGGYTVDYKVPAGNIAAAGVNFSDPAALVVNWLVGFQRDYIMATGRPLKYAICGKNIAQYLAANTQFKEYLKYNRPISDAYIQTGLIPATMEILGVTWIFAHTAFFERADGTAVQIMPDDQITFLPELGPDMYQLMQGSVPVPKQFHAFQQGGDFNSIIREMLDNQQFGAVQFAYGTALPFPQIRMVQVDTFFPDWKNPNCLFLIDTTP